jgi:hypothetical protein
MALVIRMKAELAKLREAQPGERFIQFNRRMRSESPGWMRPLYIALAGVSFVIGVVLAFIPGPAILFFALTAALLATQSSWLAERLDRAEVKGRHWLDSHRGPKERPGH